MLAWTSLSYSFSEEATDQVPLTVATASCSNSLPEEVSGLVSLMLAWTGLSYSLSEEPIDQVSLMVATASRNNSLPEEASDHLCRQGLLLAVLTVIGSQRWVKCCRESAMRPAPPLDKVS